MFPKDSKSISFYGIGICLILLGITIFAVSLVAWLSNYFINTSFVYPFVKMIGGAIIIALGYIQVELELLRKEK